MRAPRILAWVAALLVLCAGCGGEHAAGGTAVGGSGAGGNAAGNSGGGGAGGDPTGAGGAVVPPCATCRPSCMGMRGDECQGGNCCASAIVSGGTFSPGLTGSSRLTVSTFRLDDYEVTVGRYRAFVRASGAWRQAGNPVAGAGAHPNIPGSGWQADWPYGISTNCDLYPMYTLWGDASHDAMPMNCVNWFSAAAFCIWDGGRLPTEAEWEYAASGGAADTRYPWGDTPVLTGELDDTAAYAVYAVLGDGIAHDQRIGDMLPVGSRPAGRSPFGQQDMIGSLWEMVLDSADSTTFPSEATDYANVDRTGTDRVAKGGSWENGATITAASRYPFSAIGPDYARGWRCAREP